MKVLALLLLRVFISVIFIISAIKKIVDPSMKISYMMVHGMP